MKRILGTAWYPEQWPREVWADDVARMAAAGLTLVRIGEFAWSRLEPDPGRLQWGWLDDAIATLDGAGLRIVLGTPTAAPPRWMLTRHPEMLARDANGRPRGYGSRRHYCFSHPGYREECARIVDALASRYGDHSAIAAWQTDNEYGCHDTVPSYSDAARAAFRRWLRARYGTIAALNEAWGNAFWSMEYRDFDEVDLPHLTVTEPNPAHAVDFRRFGSDEVLSFDRLQTDIIRGHTDAPIVHNYMGRSLDFDHFALGETHDIASWDSYPLGFLEDRLEASDDHKRRFARAGDPDFQAFHHDLYRAVGQGRWWVMEQQPGPVNWAPYNPSPREGMVRLWSWEAFAHGAEAVVYFRWRQAPVAQEQMHAGLLRPDRADAPGLEEVRTVAAELASAPDVAPHTAPVALIFDYDAHFAIAAQPHGAGLSYFGFVFEAYRALRRLGLSVDILPPTTRDFSGHRLIVAPALVHMADGLKVALINSDARVIIGPRSAQRTLAMHIPTPLAPHLPGLDITVAMVESLRPDMPIPVAGGGAVSGWFERLEGSADVIDVAEDGRPVAVGSGRLTYVAGAPDRTFWRTLLRRAATAVGLETIDLPEGVRRRDTAAEHFWFNYDDRPHDLRGVTLEPAGVLREPR